MKIEDLKLRKIEVLDSMSSRSARASSGSVIDGGSLPEVEVVGSKPGGGVPSRPQCYRCGMYINEWGECNCNSKSGSIIDGGSLPEIEVWGSAGGYSVDFTHTLFGWIKTESFTSEGALRSFVTNYLLNRDGSAFLSATISLALASLATALVGPKGGLAVSTLTLVNAAAQDLNNANWKKALNNGGVKIVETHNALRGTSIIEFKDTNGKTLTSLSYNYHTD